LLDVKIWRRSRFLISIARGADDPPMTDCRYCDQRYLESAMLNEAKKRKIHGDYDRRWMSDDYFDLIVWYEPGAGVHGFQLCYGKPHSERALTWRSSCGFTHHRVDSGEPAPIWGLTPILVPDKSFPAAEVTREFRNRSAELSGILRDFVLTKISEFAAKRKRNV
jgi:hypothetical protein